MAQTLEVERDGAIWIARLSNPPHHTLTAEGVAQLDELVEQVERERTVRVLMLTGAGEGVFVAHYEVGELADASARASGGAGKPPAEPHEAELHPFHRVLLRLEALPAVTVAALNGSAAGGGFELALACDFRLLADGPFAVGLPETSVGIIPGAGGTQRMARLLGTARTLDLVLHAQLLSPPEALALGLVHRVFPGEGFAGAARSFAEGLAGRAPLALAAAKQAIRRGAEVELEAGLRIEQGCFERTMRSQDAAGAMRAWLAGERWTWRGE